MNIAEINEKYGTYWGVTRNFLHMPEAPVNLYFLLRTNPSEFSYTIEQRIGAGQPNSFSDSGHVNEFPTYEQACQFAYTDYQKHVRYFLSSIDTMLANVVSGTVLVGDGKTKPTLDEVKNVLMKTKATWTDQINVHPDMTEDELSQSLKIPDYKIKKNQKDIFLVLDIHDETTVEHHTLEAMRVNKDMHDYILDYFLLDSNSNHAKLSIVSSNMNNDMNIYYRNQAFPGVLKLDKDSVFISEYEIMSYIASQEDRIKDIVESLRKPLIEQEIDYFTF